MDYLELSFSISPKEPYTGILTAQLAESGFDTFEETDDGLKAYIAAALFSEKLLSTITVLKTPGLKFLLSRKTIAQRNWNEEWEKSFQPVKVQQKLIIRAPFHEPEDNFTYEIIIEPKMSFGTGHHDTTLLMAQQLLGMDVKGKRVLDMGCGTGLLAILASKMGAEIVMAVDVEEWAYGNAEENAIKNKTFNIHVEKGDANLLAGHTFHLTLANINKNVLLNDLKIYSSCLEENGELLMSGFFEGDASELVGEAEAQGLILKQQLTRNEWALLHFMKKDI